MNSNFYKTQPLKVEKRSGFDKSHFNLLTAKCGTITPIMVDELIPNTKVHLNLAMRACLPPLASDTFMRVQMKYAAFFVPTRILVPNYETWLTDSYDQSVLPNLKVQLPTVSVDVAVDSGYGQSDYASPGTLLDYLGCRVKVVESASQQQPVIISALPLLAYYRIYDDWFRNSFVQKPLFRRYGLTSAGSVYSPANSMIVTPTQLSHSLNLGDPFEKASVKFGDLMQANFDTDLFTSARLNAQFGSPQSVSVNSEVTQDVALGDFTIASLRAANSIQQFLERNNIAGSRLVDYVKAQYGADLKDSIAQRPVLLGSGAFDMYSNGVYTTATNGLNPTQNPFADSVGSQFGSVKCDGKGNLVGDFTASEPGYLMVVSWISPRVTYGTGINRILRHYITRESRSDMANPILQNVGAQPIYAYELYGASANANPVPVFGYQDRYFEFKDKLDEVHGLLRDGESLQSFALQRTFDTAPQLNDAFLQIPIDYMDQVSAVSEQISDYGAWIDCFFDYKLSMPLSQYSIPSLQDPASEHGETVYVNKAGSKIS